MSASLSTAASPRPSQTKTEKASDGGARPGRMSGLLDKLPPWISKNLRSRKSCKMLLKCWLASWLAFVIILPDPSLRTLGNAAFFALLGSMFVPPTMPIQIFLFALSTIVIGVCLGWAFGVAAMRAALAVRNQVLLRETLEREEQSVAGLADPDVLFEASIFQGVFLDTRSSAMFGAFLGVAAFLFALIRAYVPKLIITSIFATIAVDIFCAYGPLFPFAEYTLLNTLLTSLACYIAIGMIVVVCVFPETLNHAILTSVVGLLDQVQSLIELQEEVLNAPAADLLDGGAVLTRVLGAREGIIAGLRGFMGQLAMVNLEFSWGRWNGDDIKALEKPVAAATSRLAAFQSFARLLGQSLEASTNASRASLPDPGIPLPDHASENTTFGDTELLRQLRSRNHAHNVSVPLADIVPVLRNATRELREASVNALRSCKVVLEFVNTKRYVRGSTAGLEECLAELDAASERLGSAIEAFKDHDRLAILEPYKTLLEDRRKMTGSGQTEAPLRSLFISYVFTANVVTVGQSIKSLADSVAATAHKRRKNRLWAPKGLRMIGKVLTQKGDESENGTGEDPVPPEQEEDTKDQKGYRLDPDARPPSNIAQRIANALHAVYLWAKTPEAMFAFKYSFITIALWFPSIVKTSAHFVYAQKGLWALIMAQTTLNIYAADQIWNYMLRLLGTFIGLIYGLLCWYIGSAKSNGNPYGMGASVAVFLVPLVFCRIFAPPQYLTAVMMVCATWALIVGYSWIDGHIPIVGNVGIGWSVAWRRWVLVMIGCAASFIMMILPPASARKSVRYRCASTIASLSYLYSHLMAAWIDEGLPADGEKDGKPRSPEWIHEFREKLISVAEQISALRTQAAIAKFEGSIRGAWPSKEYMKLVNIESEMTANLAVLAGSLAQMDHGTRVALLRYTRVVNPNFISDVMSTFLLVSQSLRTAEPLHQAQSQDLVDRVFYHSEKTNINRDADEDANANELHLSRIQSVMSYEYMFYASGVVAVFQLLQNLNEARAITVRLCGEVKLEGFEQWREKYSSSRVPV